MKKVYKYSICIFIVLFNLFYLDAQVPLPEHPRPDFQRPIWENLNGEWDFKFDAEDKGIKEQWYKGEVEFDKKIMVPFPWGSKLSGINDEANIGWYRRAIKVPNKWKEKKTFLTIGASDWETSVWLDGKLLGKHQGGYIPFSFDLTPYLKYGELQNLILRVDDNAGDPEKFKRGYALYGKQGYGNARGIWQTVYLESRGNQFLDAIHFTPDIDNKKVNVKIYLENYATKKSPLLIRIKTENGFIEKQIIIKPGQIKRSFDIEIPKMHLWTLEDPYLYEVEATLDDDIVNSYFGMRKVSVENLPGTEFPYVALNNKPIYLQFALDQSYHPDGYYAFPNDAFIKEEILRSKSIGLNGIRVHIKVEVPRKLYWADKLGLLVVEDLPNSWGDPDKFMRNESEYTLKEMIKRDYNHPSIISWVIFNEQWGLSTKNDPEDKRSLGSEILPETYNWVASMYYLAKTLDPSRLIEDNSVCCGGVHTATDINSWHVYLAGYEWEDYLKDQTEKNFKGSSHLYYKGWKQENQPFLNSECGNVWGYTGSTGDVDWSYDYHRMINSFRKFPEVGGWLYTEHHDVINEWNGYWRFDRSEKETGLSEIMEGMTLNDFHSLLYLSTGVEICRTVNGGEKIKVPLFLSSMSGIDYGDEIIIEYELSHINQIAESKIISSNQFKIKYSPWMNKKINPIEIKMPEIAGLSKLALKVKTLNNKILHRNFMHFEVFSNKKISNTKVLSISPNNISNSKWSKKSWPVLGGKKLNGAGSGFFEYKFVLPNDYNNLDFKEAFFVIEVSAKEFFDKDKKGENYKDAGMDWMRGSIVSPSKNPNSYPMTDEKLFPSIIKVFINDKFKKSFNLSDDPADHRGVLSWHNQIIPSVKRPHKNWLKEKRVLNEAGSYGYLIKVPISKEELFESIEDGSLKVRIQTEDDGGVAVYGRLFGRYPIDPSLILKK
ncbi:MAG: glycoside hydrolase family 2 TIM barrel-domain containing protein [Flavobacteriaceae bacterium]|nr:glycoside hydrolase family 2 TIM barrel-domain containing protein [Flavobacteriaceae bacterium]